MTVVILNILVSSTVIFQGCNLQTLTITSPPKKTPPKNQTTKTHNKTQVPKTKCTAYTPKARFEANHFGCSSPENKTVIS